MRKAITAFAAAAVLAATTGPAMVAANQDPDWPCIQRKVPELSLGQIWTGPELPETAREWARTPEIAELVEELAARRLPLAEAQAGIRSFASSVPADEAKARLSMLVQGLFDHMNAERSQVISGIARYARNQLALAARLRQEASALDALRAKADASAAEIAARTDKLTWDTRIFQERVQSLTYVCEVPTLIEQRLYALAKTISAIVGGK